MTNLNDQFILTIVLTLAPSGGTHENYNQFNTIAPRLL